MRRSDIFPARWLTPDQIDGEMTVTIANGDPIDFVEFKQPGKDVPERKPVLYFKAPKGIKPLILNKTNFDKLADILGTDDTEEWASRDVRVIVVDVDVAGETKRGIRFKPARPPQPKQQPKHRPADDDDDEDAVNF